MKKAILATKVGMTQIFNEDGVLTPVTVLQAGPCVVTQIKTVENDGYCAVQVGYADKKEKATNKPLKGHFDKAGVSPKKFVKEFKFENVEEYTDKRCVSYSEGTYEQAKSAKARRKAMKTLTFRMQATPPERREKALGFQRLSIFFCSFFRSVTSAFLESSTPLSSFFIALAFTMASIVPNTIFTATTAAKNKAKATIAL